MGKTYLEYIVVKVFRSYTTANTILLVFISLKHKKIGINKEVWKIPESTPVQMSNRL